MNNAKCHIFVNVIDSQAATVEGAKVTLLAGQEVMSATEMANKGTYAVTVDPGTWLLRVEAAGYIKEERTEVVNSLKQSLLVCLGKPGETYYYANRAKVFYQADPSNLILRFAGDQNDEAIDEAIQKNKLKVLSAPPGSRSSMELGKGNLRMVAMKLQDLEPIKQALHAEVPYAIPLRQGKKLIGGLTSDLVVSFGHEVPGEEAEKLAKSLGMSVLRSYGSLPGGYVFRAKQPDLKLLEHSRTLIETKGMAVAEPDLLLDFELDAYTPNDTLYGQLRHLPLVGAGNAWEMLGNYDASLRGGSPGICIAVFDPEGVHPTHPELIANLTDGTSKLVTSFNFTAMAVQTAGALSGNHGTQCAGSATAAMDNNRGIVGVAPNCHLIGARIAGLTAVNLADAYLWAAGINNGNTTIGWPALPSKPADVISNSFGQSGLALSATMQSCFDRLTNEGRGGLGVVVTYSTGNLGYTQFSTVRTWAAYNRNIAVGASINTNPTSPTNSSQPTPTGATTNITVTVDTRALYNPYGPEMDIVAPSHTAYNPNLVDPIMSAVRVGMGNVNGCPGAGVCNDFAVTFGGTSHSSPTIAGTCALILSANPLLRWNDVHDILKRTAVKIDFGQTNAIGAYVDLDNDGVREFSQWYGYGRVNVLEAVRDALNLWVAQLVTAEAILPI